MKVRDDRGFIVWGTVPSAFDHELVGSKVKFSATVEASNDDPSFGFFKRSTQAALIQEGN